MSVLDLDGLRAWASARPELRRFGEVATITEIGDGNLNQVFRVTCTRGSFVVKQSMPYVRIDPNWPLAPERIHHEAFAYEQWSRLSPGICPSLYCSDPERYLIAVEDLVGHRVWRAALQDGEVHPSVASRLGQFIADTADRLAERRPPTAGQADWERRARNPAMRRLMEDVVFRFPYTEHPYNSYLPAVAELVDATRADPGYRAGLVDLRSRWLVGRETLLHGDLHTGSVMVDGDSVRVIDSEFSWLGPTAWDLGELIGNLLIAAICGRVVGASTASKLDRLAPSCWSGFEETWRELDSGAAGSPTLARIGRDAAGYAGLEIVRRVIGSGKADEVEQLPERERVIATSAMLVVGRDLVVHREDIDLHHSIELVEPALTAVA